MVPLILATAILFFDQLTKQLVRDNMALGEQISVLPCCFQLTYLRNTGAAWGMLGGQNDWLTLISLVMLVLLIIFHRSILNDTRSHRIALGLMIGGIIGNLIDRIKLGWVTDFLDFYIMNYHWPSFNIADAAICTGVGIYILTTWREGRKHDIDELVRKEKM